MYSFGCHVRHGLLTGPVSQSASQAGSQSVWVWAGGNGWPSAGRVKTLHPGVHGGILARRDLQEHTAALQQHGIGTIDLVVVNLYPFRATVTAREAPSFDMAIENIDIGAAQSSRPKS